MLKAELQQLLPLQVWEDLREGAKAAAAAARDDGARLAGELGAAERAAAAAAAQMGAVREQLHAWEAERAARVREKRAALEQLGGNGAEGRVAVG